MFSKKRRLKSLQERKEFVEKKFLEFKEEDFPETSDISVKQFVQMRKKKERYVLIDLRSDKERDVSIIPGTVTPKDFEENASRYADHTAVAFCTAGYRSGLYKKELQERNLPALNLVGGVIAWALDGQKFQDQVGESRRVHVFNKIWNLLPDKYDAIW